MDDFYVKSRMRDGYSNECKTCEIARTRRWQIHNAEQYQANKEKWRISEAVVLVRGLRGSGQLANVQSGIVSGVSGIVSTIEPASALVPPVVGLSNWASSSRM